MRRRSAAAQGTWAAARAVLGLAGAVALWLVRPALPHLSGSLTSPVALDKVHHVVICLAWLLGVCLAIFVLMGGLRSFTLKARRVPGILPSRGPSSAQRPVGKRARPGHYVLTIPPHVADGQAVAVSSPALADAVGAGASDASDSRSISIAVLGPLAIDGVARRIKRAATYELLSYLALHEKGASRDELIEAIWPGQDPKRTRPRFWQSVTEARKALGDAWVHEADRYQLDRSKVRVDLDDLDRLLTATSSEGADPEALERALALWRGEPLEGSDYLWADGEIRGLRATLLDLLERVGRIRLARGDPRGALQIAEQAIALDGLHEPSWRLALQAEHTLGLRESITRRYGELTRALDEQLGLEPARETRVIYRELLGQS